MKRHALIGVALVAAGVAGGAQLNVGPQIAQTAGWIALGTGGFYASYRMLKGENSRKVGSRRRPAGPHRRFWR